jgi:phosphoribosyl 1,2-cyclic phosphodiesterase
VINNVELKGRESSVISIKYFHRKQTFFSLFTLQNLSFADMSLFITSLNSGSNGNCYYVGTHTEAILVDAGISCREIEKRMQRLGLQIKNIKAVFVSHEHSDHIKGLPVLVKKYQLPVYITSATMQRGGLTFEAHLLKQFFAHQPINIGALSITAFPKFHDACDPYSFVVSSDNICIGIFTDIGTPCQQLIKYFKQCHAAFLEANYDEQMLDKGNYPIYLKNRIRGGKGHLSNRQALEIFINHKPEFMSHLLLAHLSKNNNSPELVQQLFHAHAGKIKVMVASREKETELLQIQNPQAEEVFIRPTTLKTFPEQLAFSFA